MTTDLTRLRGLLFDRAYEDARVAVDCIVGQDCYRDHVLNDATIKIWEDVSSYVTQRRPVFKVVVSGKPDRASILLPGTHVWDGDHEFEVITTASPSVARSFPSWTVVVTETSWLASLIMSWLDPAHYQVWGPRGNPCSQCGEDMGPEGREMCNPCYWDIVGNTLPF